MSNPCNVKSLVRYFCTDWLSQDGELKVINLNLPEQRKHRSYAKEKS